MCSGGERLRAEFLMQKTFLRSIKLWARHRGIYSNIAGFPGGVACAIMGAKVAQYYPNMNASMLLDKFFFLYKNWPFKNAEKKNAIMIAPVDKCLAPPGAVYITSWSMATPLAPCELSLQPTLQLTQLSTQHYKNNNV